jgi:hypothetical protein
MNTYVKFNNFLNKLKTNNNKNLIESINKGFNAIFENTSHDIFASKDINRIKTYLSDIRKPEDDDSGLFSSEDLNFNHDSHQYFDNLTKQELYNAVNSGDVKYTSELMNLLSQYGINIGGLLCYIVDHHLKSPKTSLEMGELLINNTDGGNMAFLKNVTNFANKHNRPDLIETAKNMYNK